MNTIHNNGEHDKSLDDGLDKLGHVYDQLPIEEPPELLDQAILNRAHRAVEKKPHWMKFGWLHGLTTTAVVVLAMTLVFNQREQVPMFEDEMRARESIGLQPEKAAKMQSESVQTDDLRMEMKEESAKRRDVYQSAPVSTASQNEVKEAVTGGRAIERQAGTQTPAYASDDLKAKKNRADKDATANEPVIDELRVGEADFIADAPEMDNTYKQTLPAAIAAPAASEAEAPVDNVSEIEQKLLAIIKLKQSGDKAWKTELALFKEDYPDYPVPDELSIEDS